MTSQPATPPGQGPDALAQPLRASPERILQSLSQVALLRALPPEEVQAIVPHVERCHVAAGQRVFAQGETGDALYLVERGWARVLADGQSVLGTVGPGEAFGEMALLTGEPRSATVVAETDLETWRIGREDFQQVIGASPRLEAAFRRLAEQHRAGAGLPLADADSAARRAWAGTALRAVAARHRGLTGWQKVMGFGLLLWVLVAANDGQGWLPSEHNQGLIAAVQLLAGLAILQGACEAFVQGVERLGARFRWEGFISGTIGSMVATLPEFVVIAFLVAVQPLAAFVTAVVTIYNNALAFSLYSFFLPKDQKGKFLMPAAVTKAGGEILIAGSGIALTIGGIMVVLRAATHKTTLAGADLLFVGLVLVVIYSYYTYELVRYYGEGDEEEDPGHPPAPHGLGHDTSWGGIALMFAIGIAGSYFGGESIGGFADTALNDLGLPTIPTASGLAFFAGISEYIIVYKAHRRGELSIALSNVFGGMTQVMFLLLPVSMVVIAVFGLFTGASIYAIPINTATTMLMLLLFPLFHVLLQYLQEDHTLSNLDAAAMTGIYGLLLYFLFTAPGAE